MALATATLLCLAWAPAGAAAPAPMPGTPAVVSGTIVPVLNVDPGELIRIDPIVEDGRHVAGVDCVRDQVWRHEVKVDDVRLTGLMTSTWSWDDYDPVGDTSTAWGTITIENDAGAWSGSFTGVEFPTGTMDTHAWLIGSGAYDGLAAFLCLQCSSHGPALPFDADAAHAWGTSGLIFRGMPPVADGVPVTG
jgi:hypothetical protein